MVNIHRTERRVREHAHHLWEQAGRPHGRNDEFWARAHEEIERQLDFEDEVRRRAFVLWTAAGSPLWHADRFWFEAEHMLRSAGSSP